MNRAVDRTVLIVEPDADERAQLRATLEARGYIVVATSGGDDALAIVDNPQIGLVITELYLGNRKSRCVLNAICDRTPKQGRKVLAYTRHGHSRDRAWAAASGADGYVLKKNGARRLLEVADRLSRSSAGGP